ncbi:hypothetical protein BKA82DRAFT_166632, partial [Pisolithus tinctorius]
DVILGPLSCYHIYGVVKLLSLPLVVCIPSVVISEFVSEAFLKAVEKYRVTGRMIVPPILLVYDCYEGIRRRIRSRLRLYNSVCSCTALHNQGLIFTVKKCFERAGFNVTTAQRYGLTETSPTAFILLDKHTYCHPASVGVLIPNPEIRLAREVNGETWVGGPNVTEGYFKNSLAAAAVIIDDDWFKTGNIAVRSKDGFFRFVDRRKELTKYKVQLKSLSLQHPDVVDAAVTGVPDTKETELARYISSKVISCTEEGSEAASFALDIQERVARRAAPHKKLRGGIVLVENVPRSAPGKILRRELRDCATSDLVHGQVGIRVKL